VTQYNKIDGSTRTIDGPSIALPSRLR
jgi:hypothetical protein